ncbi:MAG: adenine deaminase [Desulfobacteraceae bacterium 4572_87]|nr:MAG: adenine deaminase [Desulfobacteraceae bacterium 4572_87]
MKSFSGNIVDVINGEIFPGTIDVKDGRILEIHRDGQTYENYITPGFIDAHVHIESAMMPPSEFARIASIHGTVAAVCDPHEIANVVGLEGVRYMIENAIGVPLKFYFSAPSCVPATPFETSGAQLTLNDMETLLRMPDIKFLGEMMNFPGVIFDDPEVLEKLKMAKRYHKAIDGHSPGLSGDDLRKYISAGITTDHECFTKEEALEKLSLGMKILIREGSAVKNFDDLIPIADEHYKNCMFCSDDKHPDELLKGHMNDLVRRALATGLDRMKVFQMACINPVTHYGLDVGCLRKGDPADFLVIDDFEHLHIQKTVIRGETVAENGRTLLPRKPAGIVNRFAATPKNPQDFAVPDQKRAVNIIDVIDGQLITKRSWDTLEAENGRLTANTEKDILKIAVVNRYADLKPAVGFVRNFGLKHGAIAGSIAHDSHNIIVVGISDEDICSAVNLIIANKGGICAVCETNNIREILPLPIAGLMGNEDFETVAGKYTRLDKLAKEMGSTLYAPFMTLSFMALLVIPEIKLSDKGLFDGTRFEFMDLFAEADN